MPTFDVRFVQDGRTLHRRIAAPEPQAVAALLGVAASQLLAVRPVTDASAVATPRRLPATGAAGFPLRLFSQELAVLLAAGIPLLEAVVTLREKEAAPAVAAVLDHVAGALRQGEPLSAAAAQRPHAFDSLFVALVAAAERSGQLVAALQAHARYLGWVDSLRQQLLGAAIYPLMLLAASAAVMLFLLMFVVPRVAGVLEGVGGPGVAGIPAGSRLLLLAGQWCAAHPLPLLATVATTLVALTLAARTPQARGIAANAAWALPLLGPKLRLLALARLFRTLSMLLGSGVPALAALRITRGVVAARLQPALDAACEAVSTGRPLSTAFDATGLSTPVSSRMLRVGERSGALGEMLGQAAAFYDEELLRLSELVTRLVNPLLMLLMGGVIGTVVVLLYLPIFQLAEQVP
jgi:general secretion pathway protein F